MDALGLFLALSPALIWSYSIVLYRDYLKENSSTKLNLYRMLFASITLALPFLIFGFNEGIIYAFLSGMITLGIGDSFFLISIKKVGASIATPVAFSYVFLSQIAAILLGEQVKSYYILSALLIILGISFLSNSKSEMRISGILTAGATAIFWTTGQAMIKLATIENMNPLSISFSRVLAAFIFLSLFSLFKDRDFRLKLDGKRTLLKLYIISAADLALGSSLFVFSIAYSGLAITVIITSLTPLLTQFITKVSGRENPSKKDIGGGILITLAIILSLL